MNQPPTNICPLIAIGSSTTSGPAVCLFDRCAFWDFGGCECALVTAAVAIREVAENLEALAVNSQALGNLTPERRKEATP